MEESQAQVDRYKSLLQKQRDIMIALTTRLNERDEAIGQLQEELDAYDKIHKEAERSMDFYKRRVSTLENELNRRGINLPNESGDYHRKDNRVAPQEDKDTVKLGEIETFNINYKNLSFAQEKIEELREIAEERERKIEQLEIERQELLEHDQNKGHDLATALKENTALRKKAEEYQRNVKRLKDNKGSDSENSNMEYVTTSVDEIVSNLSKQNDPKTLQNVARMLLRLQKYVHSLPSIHDRAEKEGTMEFGISKYIVNNTKNAAPQQRVDSNSKTAAYANSSYGSGSKLIDLVFKK